LSAQATLDQELHTPHVAGEKAWAGERCIQRCVNCGFALRGVDGRLLELPVGTQVKTPRNCKPVQTKVRK
jgi:hypothetical protein